MGSLSGLEKPHVVCVPFPAQGHINPMMNLAKLLHFHGFHITFVLTDYNHARLLRSRGPRSLDGTPSFRFASIPDGLPPTDADATQDVPQLCASVDRHCEAPFTDLLKSLNAAAAKGAGPPVTCIVSDAALPFTLEAAETLGIREVLFWTASACAFLGYEQYPYLVQQGYTPFKDDSDFTNGYLDQPVDWIPSMKGIRLKDIPTFMRTTDPDDIMLNYLQSMFRRSRKAAGIIFNTFDALELNVLQDLAPLFPPIYTVGPLNKLVTHTTTDETTSIGSNLWKEDEHCIEWLDSQKPGSVVYVNFGSITVMSNEQLVEFAFGLANSGAPFLWVIRPDLVTGDAAVLPPEFSSETGDRSLLADWCDQERVLNHPAVGGFLTHSGWNSTLESISSGVPMICWPFFADQQTNCWFCCGEWGVAMEIDEDVKREGVERQVREMMEGKKGEEMRRRVAGWKRLAEAAAAEGSGRSWLNLEKAMDVVRKSG